MNNRRILIFLLCYIAFLMVFSGTSYALNYYAESIGAFDISVSDSLQFQNSHLFLLSVDSGAISTTNAQLSLTDSYGRLWFTAASPATITLSSPDGGAYDLQTSGVTVTPAGSYVNEVSYSSGASVVLYWRFALDSPAALPSLNVQWLWTYLYEGNFAGLFSAILATAFNSYAIGIAVIVMIFLAALYIRTGSLLLICIAWLLIGGFLIVAIPIVSGMAIIFMVLGVGGLIYKLFRPSS